ncbi:MAG: hypothetical protein MJ196_07305 [Treponemataceae bacterium]|nr:hypothetical protein [Treponemataceae bacterium]
MEKQLSGFFRSAKIGKTSPRDFPEARKLKKPALGIFPKHENWKTSFRDYPETGI